MGKRRTFDAQPARTMWVRHRCACLGLVVVWLVASAVRGAEPEPRAADILLRLVPPDSGLVLTVEGLRDQAAAFLQSRLADDLWQLPAVRAWLASEKYQQFERSRERIEAVLGANLTKVRDEILGDAVVLALRLPPDAPADNSQARGILLCRVRDLALLNRLIDAINTSQRKNGELAGIVDRQRNGTTYHIREFPPAVKRPSECYVIYPDGTFAFSNSEALIQSVIDRKDGLWVAGNRPAAGVAIEPGLGALPKLKSVVARLPQKAVVRLFADPRHFERLLAATTRPEKPTDARFLALIERYLSAVEYAGAALTWSEKAVVIHTVETINPSLLDPWMRRWISDPRRVNPDLLRVPATALAVASGHVDAQSLFEAISHIVPDEDQARLTNIETVLSGVLLGEDVRTKVLPRLGPGIVAYFETPASLQEQGVPPGSKPAEGGNWPAPFVMVISLSNEPDKSSPTAGAAVDNALRTVLAMMALDEKRTQGRSRITTRAVAGATVTTLDPPINFAYAIDQRKGTLIVGTSAGSVARYLESASDPKAGDRFRKVQSDAFRGAETFLCVDFDALNGFAAKYRDRLLEILASRQQRPIAEIDRDLAQAQALARLFRAGFITSRFEADASTAYRSVGLVRRNDDKP
jgi:hypothetical protein